MTKACVQKMSNAIEEVERTEYQLGDRPSITITHYKHKSSCVTLLTI